MIICLRLCQGVYFGFKGVSYKKRHVNDDPIMGQDSAVRVH